MESSNIQAIRFAETKQLLTLHIPNIANLKFQ